MQGRTNLNRAVDGDIVAVEILPDDQWLAPSEIVLQDEENADDADDASEDEKVLAKASSLKTKEKVPTGKIVGIIRRKWRQYCGILQPSPIKGVRVCHTIIHKNNFYIYCVIIYICVSFLLLMYRT